MAERVLLHICCGPCALYPASALREEGFELMGFFFNPNIQPYQEYLKRGEVLKKVGEDLKLSLLWAEDYQLKEWLRAVSFREEQRCELCYYLRLSETARYARKGKFDYFSSTIFYSKFQKHELAKEVAFAIEKEYQVKFLYRDFREGWKKGVELSHSLGLYRQKYCGCVYSEYERFKGARDNEEGGG